VTPPYGTGYRDAARVPTVTFIVTTLRGRQPSDESGFTIVELTIAMGLLAIVAASMAGLFWAAIGVAGMSAHRSDATSIASREIEAMRAVPYTSLGFYADQTGYPSGGKWVDPRDGQSYDVVTLGASTPSTPAQIQPVTPDPAAAVNFKPDPQPDDALPIVQGGVTFSVHRYIVWATAQDASSTYVQAYKHTTVIVTWSDRAGAHSIRQDSIVYPGGQGKYNGAQGAPVTTTTSTTVALTPNAPSLDSISAPAQFQLNVSWTPSAAGAQPTGFVVEWSTASNMALPTNGPVLTSNFNSYAITGLAPATTYYVAVIAYVNSTASPPSNVLSQNTQTQSASCVLGPLSVAGATSKSTTGTILQRNGKMSEDLTLSWTTSGPCTDTYSVKAVDSSNQPDLGSPYSLTTSVGGNFSATVSAANNKGWATGTHTFTVFDITTGQPTVVVKTFKVCVFGVASC
jgi:type II secretory pathway pseudopilin PulG